MNVQLDPLKIWPTEKGEVRLFCEKGKLKFDVKSAYKIDQIAIENIKGLPEKVQKTENCTAETISNLFKKIYPKVVELRNGDLSLQFIDNCFEGMEISVNLLSRTIPFEASATVSPEDNEPIGLPAKIIPLTVNPTDTVEEIKEKIRQKVRPSPNEPLVLTYQDETLKSDASLVNCKISNGATISQIEKAVREINKVVVSFEFNSLQEKIEVDFSARAPDYRIVNPGLNLEGKCKTKDCPAENKFVWIQKGMGTFDIGLHVNTSNCPKCNQTVEEVHNLSFWDCIYSVDGFPITPKKGRISMTDQVAGEEKLTTFAGSNALGTWSYMKISTKPL